MRFEELTVTWKYSLSLLAWKELRLLLLASLNNFRRALKLTATHFWWLWLLWLVLSTLPILVTTFFIQSSVDIAPFLDFSFSSFCFDENLSTLPVYHLSTLPLKAALFTGFSVIFSLANLLISFTYYLSTRASVEAKNFAYYRIYAPKIFFFFVTKALVNFGLALLLFLPTLILLWSPPLHLLLVFILFFVFAAFPILVGFVFFDFDRAKVFFIIKKSFMLFIRFLPIFLLVSVINLLLLALLYGIAIPLFLFIPTPLVFSGLSITLFALKNLIVTLFVLSCYATIYIKIKHTHPNLFFAE